jgi:hypothetical protein
MHNRYIRLMFYFILIWVTFSFYPLPLEQDLIAATNGINKTPPVNGQAKAPHLLPSLVISQREMDLGTLTMGQEKEGSFSIKNIGSDSLAWSILPPEDWFPLDKTELLGISVGNEEMVTLRISVIKKDYAAPEANISTNLPVQLTIENRSNRLACVRDLPAGFHRDTIKIQSASGIKKTLFIKFNLVPNMEDTSISVNPPRLDFGSIKMGEPATKRIRLTNKSSDNVRWQVSLTASNGALSNMSLDRFISFANDEVSGKGTYAVPARMEKQLQLSGSWREYQGYPAISGKTILKLDFYGSALALFVKKLSSDGQFSAYIDNNLVKSYEFSETDEDYEFYEIPITDSLMETNHVLTLALNGNGIAIEGVRVKRQDVLEGKRDWIAIFPESGFTLKETDYINITLNPVQTNPGIYANTIHIASNNGSFDVPLSYEVIAELPPQNVDIYRYFKGGYYLYISSLPTDEMRLTSKGFIKQGLAFSLFQPGTLGTVPFHRWYNPNIINQFFSYDYNKGNSLLGYVYEGAIGNIATSRLTNARELYRWYNPQTRQHFFSLDPKGEGMSKKGYVFDGIAGYVK